MENTQINGLDGEKKVYAVLTTYGHKVELMPSSWSAFDILMDGKIKLEVKTSRPYVDTLDGGKMWRFNIHRHNKVDETGVDYYILRLEGIPGSKKAIHALLKAPLGMHVLEYSERQLLEGALADGVKAFRELNLNRRIKKGA